MTGKAVLDLGCGYGWHFLSGRFVFHCALSEAGFEHGTDHAFEPTTERYIIKRNGRTLRQLPFQLFSACRKFSILQFRSGKTLFKNTALADAAALLLFAPCVQFDKTLVCRREAFLSPSSSGSGMPARRARKDTASRNSRFSISMMKLITPPP